MRNLIVLLTLIGLIGCSRFVTHAPQISSDQTTTNVVATVNSNGIAQITQAIQGASQYVPAPYNGAVSLFADVFKSVALLASGAYAGHLNHQRIAAKQPTQKPPVA